MWENPTEKETTMADSRETLRNQIMETLMATFPNAQKVAGGVAFLSDVIDEETGKYFPVEIKCAVKNTKDTQRSAAYDLEAAVADFAAKPGRRTADPNKANTFIGVPKSNVVEAGETFSAPVEIVTSSTPQYYGYTSCYYDWNK